MTMVDEHGAATAASNAGKDRVTPPALLGVAEGLAEGLTEGQKAVWVDHRTGLSTRDASTLLGLRIRGELNIERLRNACELVCDHAPILRSVVEEVEGVPYLRADPAWTLAFRHEVRRGAAADDIVASFVARGAEPLALDTGPLFQVDVVSRAPDDHLLLVVAHPLVLDEPAAPALFEAWWKAYDALARRDRPVLAAPVHAELARWEDRLLAGDAARLHQAYWRDRLAGRAVLELPTDRPRTPGSESEIDRQVVGHAMTAEHTAQLEHASCALGVGAAAYLLGAFDVLLQRYTGETDLVVGMPAAVRADRRFEHTIGPFLSTIAVRSVVDGSRPFSLLVRGVEATIAQALTHVAYPFPRLARDVGASRHQAPLFHVAFFHDDGRAFDRPELAAPSGGALQVERLVGLHPGAKFGPCELGLEAIRLGRAYRLSLVYDARRFDRATIERMMGHYVRLLDSAMRAPELPIARQALLSPEEANPVLLAWNQTAEPFLLDRCVQELVEDQVARTPGAPALSHGDRSLTYDELNRRANQIAHALRAQGIGPDRLVAIYMHRGLDMIVSVLAILKAGGAYLPLDPSYPADRIEYMLRDAAPGVVLTQAQLRDRLPAGAATVIALDTEGDAIAGQPGHNLDIAGVGVRPRHLAFVIYTSGSTGQPKGVAMHHASLVNLLEWHREGHSGSGRQRTLQFAALGFDVAFQEAFSTLSVGGTLVIIDEDVRRDPEALCRFVRDHAIGRMFMPFGALQSIADAMDAIGGELPSLQDVITGGEQLRISPSILRLFRRTPSTCSLYNHYGPTETHVITSEKLPADRALWPELPSIGRPIANTHVYILDPQQQPVPIGVPGEIYIGGVAVARGYLTRPDLTQERFLPDPFRGVEGARMYRTGDVARFGPDGRIEFLGRNDHQVKIRGFRVELGEIEAQLSHHPKVREVAVIARADAVGTKRLIAYLTPVGETPAAAELRSHLKASLPDFMIPSVFVVSASLPRSPNGKLDRRALPAPEDATQAAQAYEAPRGDREAALARIWAELMGVERVGRHDNFFEIGGHSLMVMQVVVRIRERLALELPPRAVFEHRTLAALAEYIATVDEARKLARRGGPGAGTGRTRGSL